MAQTAYNDSEWHRSRQRVSDRQSAQNDQPSVYGCTSNCVPSYAQSLLGARGLNSSVNSSTQISMMQGMQRTHGNRAVQRIVQGRNCTPGSEEDFPIEDRIMEKMRLLTEWGGSSGGSGGGEGGSGLGGWLSGAASKAVDWIGQGVSKVGEAAGEVAGGVGMGPLSPRIPEVGPAKPGPSFPPWLPEIIPTEPAPYTPPFTPWNPYMQPEEPEPSIPPFTPWNPHMQPDEDPFNSPWVIY